MNFRCCFEACTYPKAANVPTCSSPSLVDCSMPESELTTGRQTSPSTSCLKCNIGKFHSQVYLKWNLQTKQNITSVKFHPYLRQNVGKCSCRVVSSGILNSHVLPLKLEKCVVLPSKLPLNR